jgi:hypothetical protein
VVVVPGVTVPPPAQLQRFHGVQLGAFVVVLRDPEGQGVQARFVLGVPSVDTYVPMEQVAQAVQLPWFSALVKPVVHAEQRRSVVVLPVCEMYVPFSQSVQSVQVAAFSVLL